MAGVLLLSACQSDEPRLSSTQSEVISSPTPNVNFPTTQVGQTSGPIGIQINPIGVTSWNDIVAITESCPDFAVQAELPGVAYRTCESTCYQQAGAQREICPEVPYASAPPCGPGSETYSYYFTATYAPTAAVASSCPVTIHYNDPSAKTYTVTLNGTGSPPPIAGDAVPASVNFGDVRVGNGSSGATITLRNIGGQQINVSGASVPGPFTITGGNTGAYALAAGTSHAYTVTCTPGAVGVATGTFTVTSGNYGNISTQVRCNGVDSALDISPSPAAVATTRVSEPQTTSIALVNSGGAPMSIASVALAGTDMEIMSAPPPGTVLAASGGRADVTIRFMANTAGDVDGTLTVMYDGGQTRTSTVSARALTTSMSVSPSGNVDLGPVCIGGTVSKEFTVVANAPGPFAVQDVAVSNAAFTLEALGLPAAVQGDGASSYKFTVAMAPTDPGVQSNTLSLQTDIPGAAPVSVEVYATGLAAGVSGTPSELYLGATDVGETTVAQYVTVTNCGESPVDLSGARIDGVEADEFSIVLPPDNLQVPAGGSLQWLVIARPSSVGEKRADFLVDHAGGTVVVALVGDGLGTTAGGTAGTPDYYACSAGGAATGAGPLALVLGFVIRRRRRR